MIILVGMRFGTVGLVGWVLLHTVVEMRVEQGRCDKIRWVDREKMHKIKWSQVRLLKQKQGEVI